MNINNKNSILLKSYIMNTNKQIFTIHFPSIKILLAISALLVLLRCCSVIDWPIWALFFPIYAPYCVVFLLFICFYVLKYSILTIIYIIEKIIKCYYVVKRYISSHV